MRPHLPPSIVFSTGILYHHLSPSDPPPYDNPQFITAFSQSFMSLAKYYDVNIKFDLSNITPYWDEYYIRRIEMLFNHTDAGAPVVTPTTMDPELAERCTYVHFLYQKLVVTRY